MKPGTRLKSATCDAEVMVIRSGDGQIECGGVAMGEAPKAQAIAAAQLEIKALTSVSANQPSVAQAA